MALHHTAQRRRILNVQLHEREPLPGERFDESGGAVRLDVGERHLTDGVLLQQIVGTGGPLQARAEYQHAHAVEISQRT